MDSAMRTSGNMSSQRFRFSHLAFAIASIAALAALGCSDDGEPNDSDGNLGGSSTGGRKNTSGGSSAGGSSPGGDNMGGAAGEGSGGAPEVRGHVVSGWINAPEGWFGFLSVTDDFSNESSVDLEEVLLLDGDHTVTGFGGAVYVGLNTEPVIQKYVVDGGRLELDGQVSFAALGVTNTFGANSNVIQIVDETTGWFFDHASGRVVVFNPSTMTTAGKTIDYSEIYAGLDMDGQDPEDDWPDVGDVGRVGDYIVVPTFWYESTDWSIPLETRAALISTVDESVKIITDDRCAGSTVMSQDTDGNLYFGPHAAAALYQGAGDALHSEPCIIRIKNGEAEFDSEYLVNLLDHSDGKVVAGLYQGPNSTAYVLEFQGDPADGAKARFAESWELASVSLGTGELEYTKVKGHPLSHGIAYAFTLSVAGEPAYYISSSGGEGASESLFYRLTEDGPEPALQVPTEPYLAVDYY